MAVDDTGTYPLCYDFQKNMHCVGPMCRYAADLRPMLKIFAGPESSALLNLDEKVDLRGLKLYYMEEIRSNLVSPVSHEQWTVLKQVLAPKFFFKTGKNFQKSFRPLDIWKKNSVWFQFAWIFR